MRITELREIIKKRIALDPNDSTVEAYWKEEAAILSENVEETIKFFSDECSTEEFSCLCEVFDDVIEKTQSRELIALWEEKLESVNDEKDKQLIKVDIEFAKERLK